MKRLSIGGIAAALLLVFGWSIAQAEDKPGSADAGGGGGLFSGWFGWAKKPAPKKPAANPAPQAAEKSSLSPRPTTLVDEAAAEQEKEVQALLRRQMVCLKLMRIALDTHNDELMRKAEQLDELARALYTQRTAHVLSNPDAGFVADEKILEKHLGPTNTSARRPADRASRPGAGSKPATQALAEEGMP